MQYKTSSHADETPADLLCSVRYQNARNHGSMAQSSQPFFPQIRDLRNWD